MNAVGVGLAAALASAAAAAVAALSLPARWRPGATGTLTSLSGIAAVAAGAAAVAGGKWRADLADVLPLAGISLAADPLAGWFVLVVGAVTVVAGVYTIGYVGTEGRGPGSRTALTLLPAFTGSMTLVPFAADVATLLVTWELMAVTSLLLVLTEHRHHRSVRAAGIWYATMTQAGFVSILAGLFWLAAHTGSTSFAAIRAASPESGSAVAAGVFLLCLFGFASKAGAVPLHPWLPRAHAEAPSHVSALMSAAMVKLGVYGLLRVGFDLLHGGQRWWWLIVAAFGAVSALYGILQAALATDLKRLLAFSTSENIGLILLGLGFAGLLTHSGNPVAAGLAMVAALLHTANHAAFKTLLFTAAGSVVRATGTRDLDALGGLSRRMPATTAMITVGALAAAALPPGNGFVSEWLLLQSLLHPGEQAGTVMSIVSPLAVAVVALTAGLGVATYVKAVGTGFLARPRSPAAADATESPTVMLVAMGTAALACAGLAVAPAALAAGLNRVTVELSVGPAPIDHDVLALRLSGITAGIAPLWIVGGLIAVTAATAMLARWFGRARRRAIAWDCGDGPLTPRMEYTATSFAEPLQRVFDDVLAPEHDVDVSHQDESAYHVQAIRFRQRIPDRVEDRLYRPLLHLLHRLGSAARGLASGSMHRYLAYMFTALIVVLLAGVLR